MVSWERYINAQRRSTLASRRVFSQAVEERRNRKPTIVFVCARKLSGNRDTFWRGLTIMAVPF